MDLVAASLQDGAAKIVIKDDPGRPGPILESAHVATQEVFRGLVEEEFQIQRSRPGQGHDEAGELPFGAADHDGAKVGPVNLCLLGWKHLQAEKGFLRLRAQTGHRASQLLDTARVATIPDHLVKARSAQARMLLQCLTHKGQIRIDKGRPQRLGVLETFHLNRAPHGVGVDAQNLCNGADFPMLGVEIAANLYAGFGGDHPNSPSSWNVWERIDETAWPAADRAAQPRTRSLFQPAGGRHSQRDRGPLWGRRRDRFSTVAWCRRNDRKGRLIRHARPAPTLAIVLLPIPVVEPSLRTLLIAAVGRPVLPASCFSAARRAAVALAAVAMCTNPEHRLASLAAANALPENHFSMNRHPPRQADFDNGNGSCQGKTSLDGDLLMKVAEPEPRCFDQRGSPPPSKPQYKLSWECFGDDD